MARGIKVSDYDMEMAKTSAASSPTTTASSNAFKDQDNTIAWNEIRCSVRTPKGDSLELIHGVSGAARSGELVAIVGPSGAGKSCMLDILTCRKTVGHITGNKTYNGATVTQPLLQEVSSYVTQEDAFHPTQTVLEAVMFHADMRLDANIPQSEKLQMAQEMIDLAGLKGKENQRVGGLLPGGIRIRGLSGGEKRRLSLCCASITNPDVLFADEPTSGLDSLSALMIVKLLRRFCDEGMIVFCTIHQPRQDIWDLFDKVLVLAKGYELFYGSPDEAEAWFTSSLGAQRPAHTCPADFILDQANIDFCTSQAQTKGEAHSLNTLEDLKRAADNFRVNYPKVFDHDLSLVRAVADEEEKADIESGDTMAAAPPTTPRRTQASWFAKYRVLLARNCNNYIRNFGNVLTRIALTMTGAILTGLVYHNMGAREKTPQMLDNIFGAVFMNIFTMYLLPFASLSGFLYDRQFFQGENAAGIYPVSAYYAANLTLEVLFNSINAFLFAVTTYTLTNYQAFVGATGLATAVGFIGIVIVSSNIANIVILCASLASPNQEVAFVAAAALQIISLLTGGIVVKIPRMTYPVSSLHYVSMLKYSCQAIFYLFFQDTPAEVYLHQFGFDKPEGLASNLLACAGIYVFFASVGFVCLKYLYKEKR